MAHDETLRIEVLERLVEALLGVVTPEQRKLVLALLSQKHRESIPRNASEIRALLAANTHRLAEIAVEQGQLSVEILNQTQPFLPFRPVELPEE